MLAQPVAPDTTKKFHCRHGGDRGNGLERGPVRRVSVNSVRLREKHLLVAAVGRVRILSHIRAGLLQIVTHCHVNVYVNDRVDDRVFLRALSLQSAGRACRTKQDWTMQFLRLSA